MPRDEIVFSALLPDEAGWDPHGKGAVSMSHQDTFKGAENAFAIFFLLLDEVAQKIGLEQAMALSARADTALGSEVGAMLRIEADVAEFDALTVATLAQNLIEEKFGILSEIIEDRSDQVAFQIRACPVYEAARRTGMEHENIEAFCHAGPLLYMDAVVKALNADLSYRLRSFRSPAVGYCEEEIVLI
jgi:hypothetical protein